MASLSLLRASNKLLSRPAMGLRASFSSVGGFSYPAPRKLDEIVKLELLSKEPRDKVETIWKEFHKKKVDNIAEVWSTTEFNNLQAASKETSSTFIFPVPREGGYFSVISQIQGTHILFTYLEDYRNNPHNAQPYLVITFYKELSKLQDLVLVRGDIMPGTLNNAESVRLLNLIKKFYAEEKEVISNFSKGIFDFEAHVEKTLKME
jgi:ATP synthase mitochondrial F1 complex assembly factor 1